MFLHTDYPKVIHTYVSVELSRVYIHMYVHTNMSLETTLKAENPIFC